MDLSRILDRAYELRARSAEDSALVDNITATVKKVETLTNALSSKSTASEVSAVLFEERTLKRLHDQCEARLARLAQK